MSNPKNQWTDPQQWAGQFTETASQTVDTVTNNMKMWNSQVKQLLDITTKTVNTTMENMQKANDEAIHAWEQSANQIKDAYKSVKK